MEEVDEINPVRDVPKRMGELFLLHYFTLIAIIEGVAMIMTIEHLFTPLAHHEMNYREWLETLPYGITSFVIIIITTFQYAIFLILFRWKIRVSDTVFPYLLGFFQAAQTFFFHSPLTWWGLFIPLAAIGWVTLIFTRNHIKDSYFKKEHQVKVKKSVDRIITLLAGSTLYPTVVFILILAKVVPETYAWFFLLVPMIMSVVFLKLVLKGFGDIKEMLEKVRREKALYGK